MFGSKDTKADSIVLELFTSQGCSSCPPADKIIGELAKSNDLVALTMPVTYWDYLGWRDTFAKDSFTDRQKSYAASRGDRSVYTPQIVVNGLNHVVGSDRSAIRSAIKDVKSKLDKYKINIDVVQDDSSLLIKMGQNKFDENFKAVVWLVLYSDSEAVSIGRGENSGRTVTYHNIVRDMMEIGNWDGDADEITLPSGILNKDKIDGGAILIQAGKSGPIIGASKFVL